MQLGDPCFFLQDNIPDNVIRLIQPYIVDNKEFQPASIAKVSKACTSICQWVQAMYVYHFVAKAVKPKKVKPELHISAETLINHLTSLSLKLRV